MEQIINRIGDVKIFGRGEMGGKGDGLVKINEHAIPKAHKLRTRILTTDYYDTYLKTGGLLSGIQLSTVKDILKSLGPIPISVRSSATNEAVITPGGDQSVHAGENRSFMLPNNHPDDKVRLRHLTMAIREIFREFKEKQPAGSNEKMAVIINPIPGIREESQVGPIYFPIVSGVANSFFPHALKSQSPKEGFARLALGHGYAAVLDDFPVPSMATIKNPIPLKYLGDGQKYFYAIDLNWNRHLTGDEMQTMKKLHIRFARSRLISLLGRNGNLVSLSELIENDRFGFKSGLEEIMDAVSKIISSHFQIEFVFNFDTDDPENSEGTFHIVQLTRLPKLDYQDFTIPKRVSHTYLKIHQIQGHGIKRGIESALVVSPFIYHKEMHDQVKSQLAEKAKSLSCTGEKFIIIVPGRLGSKNRDWGIQLEYQDIGLPEAIFEYGVDISGRPEPVRETLTGGGVYGSHFLYMIQGGYQEEQRRLQTRMFGTQGTHFLTNLMSNNIIYGFIAPMKDRFDPWFFSPPEGSGPLYKLGFPSQVSIYGDLMRQKCVCMIEGK